MAFFTRMPWSQLTRPYPYAYAETDPDIKGPALLHDPGPPHTKRNCN